MFPVRSVSLLRLDEERSGRTYVNGSAGRATNRWGMLLAIASLGTAAAPVERWLQQSDRTRHVVTF